MNRTQLAAFAAALCLIPSGVFAQQAPVTPACPPDATPRWSPAPGAQQQQTPELYQLRPGYYVYPAPYGPDYWSPHIRPHRDYSDARRRFTPRRRHLRPWQAQR